MSFPKMWYPKMSYHETSSHEMYHLKKCFVPNCHVLKCLVTKWHDIKCLEMAWHKMSWNLFIHFCLVLSVRYLVLYLPGDCTFQGVYQAYPSPEGIWDQAYPPSERAWDQAYPPLKRVPRWTDRHLWKHYLPVTTVAVGNNRFLLQTQGFAPPVWKILDPPLHTDFTVEL